MQETWISSLGWEDPLEEGVKIHSLPGESHGQKSLASAVQEGKKESDMTQRRNNHHLNGQKFRLFELEINIVMMSFFFLSGFIDLNTLYQNLSDTFLYKLTI